MSEAASKKELRILELEEDLKRSQADVETLFNRDKKWEELVDILRSKISKLEYDTDYKGPPTDIGPDDRPNNGPFRDSVGTLKSQGGGRPVPAPFRRTKR